MVWFLQFSLRSKILALNLKEIKIWHLSWLIIHIDWCEKDYRFFFKQVSAENALSQVTLSKKKSSKAYTARFPKTGDIYCMMCT